MGVGILRSAQNDMVFQNDMAFQNYVVFRTNPFVPLRVYSWINRLPKTPPFMGFTYLDNFFSRMLNLMA